MWINSLIISLIAILSASSASPSSPRGDNNALKDLSSKCLKSEVDYCFGYPDKCFAATSSANCEILVALTNHGSGVTTGSVSFQLIGTTDQSNSGWVAVGLSDDNRMGNDAVVDCLALKNGSTALTNSWNRGHSNAVFGDVTGVVGSASVLNENGIIDCKWTRKVETVVEEVKFDLIAKKYYLLLASGPVNDEGLKLYHSYHKLTSDAVNLTSVHS